MRAIVKNPWSSVQDGLLLASVMLVAALLALELIYFGLSPCSPSLSAKYR